jgi:hypothetical protein
MMQKQTYDPRPAREQSPSLSERIAHLRRRRTALTRLIDSLTVYAQCARQESGLTYTCYLHDLSMQLPD